MRCGFPWRNFRIRGPLYDAAEEHAGHCQQLLSRSLAERRGPQDGHTDIVGGFPPHGAGFLQPLPLDPSRFCEAGIPDPEDTLGQGERAHVV